MEYNDLNSLQNIMNKELKLYEWLCINRLSLNISKTNFVLFCPINKPKIPVTILINNKAIDEAQYVKYLGILIDSQLSFKYHIEELNKKISRAIGLLYKLRPFVTTKILINVYYAIVYPFLLYGITIWGNASSNFSHLFTYCKINLFAWQPTMMVTPILLGHLSTHHPFFKD